MSDLVVRWATHACIINLHINPGFVNIVHWYFPVCQKLGQPVCNRWGRGFESHLVRAILHLKIYDGVLCQNARVVCVCVCVCVWGGGGGGYDIFLFHPMNASILHLKDEYDVRYENCLASYSHCYIVTSCGGA